MDDQDRGLGAILVRGRNINKNLAGLVDRFLLGLEGGVVALEDFAFGQGQGEFEGFAFWIFAVGKVRIDFVSRADGKVAVAFRAGVFRVGFSSDKGFGLGEQYEKVDSEETALASCQA